MHKLKWIIPNILAGGQHPLLNDEFNLIDMPDWYTKRGINCIISVFDVPISDDIIKIMPWNYIFQPTSDGFPSHNLYKLCEIISKSNGAFVHCFAGTGRTATILAAYLLFNKNVHMVKEAILLLRKYYDKGAVHTPEQYLALLQFNHENKSHQEINNDLNELFKKENIYTINSKYTKLLDLIKKEIILNRQKFGIYSSEYVTSLDRQNKIEKILNIIKSIL